MLAGSLSAELVPTLPYEGEAFKVAAAVAALLVGLWVVDLRYGLEWRLCVLATDLFMATSPASMVSSLIDAGSLYSTSLIV